MRIGARLGVDVGAARIGVAASDETATVVLPVETVKAHPRRAALKRIVQLANERNAIEVVVGLPKHLSGDEGESASAARRFAGELASKLTNVRVCLVDERLTTTQAQHFLYAAGLDSRKQRKVIDQMAAHLILEQAIDIERQTGNIPGTTVSMDERKAEGS